jgi:hypothetical protein
MKPGGNFMSSIYVMAVHELAKKERLPAAELIDRLRNGGFPVKNHLQRLTQKDLDKIAIIFQGGTVEPEPEVEKPVIEAKPEPVRTELTTRELYALAETVKQPNLLIVQKDVREFVVAVVETLLTENEINVKVLYEVKATSKGRAILERNKLAYIFRTEAT